MLRLLNAALLAATLVALIETQSAHAQRAGGPCSYADYPGTASIIAVDPVPRSTAGSHALPYQPYRVVFTFTPRTAVPHPLYAPAKTYELTLSGGQAPGPAFLKKYGIRVGASFTTQLHLITAGTCSPVVFTFHGIDVYDRFELK
jgi:hypothetical protein